VSRAFVLVHGAWGGSWMWARLARLLRAAECEVYTPSLTGIGERVHLATAETDLSTHVDDVLNTLRYEALSDIVLVGHSYGGMVVTGVADQAPERVATLVYLDAFVPQNNQALADLLSVEARAAMLSGSDWRIAPRTPQMQGMTDPDEIAWIAERRGFQPRKTFTQPLSVAGRYRGPKVYVYSGGYAPSSFTRFAANARSDSAWAYHELPTHHYPQVSMPRETAALLLKYA
jgi:pimeloyl-ACP methyl ester carboxylesterase